MYEREIAACIDRCLKMEEDRPRKSSVWFEEFRENHGIASLQKLDQEIFFRMYGKKPCVHDVQRVRFWRLSQHLPRNREECVRLGRALELSGHEMDLFLTEGLCSQRLSDVENREEIIGQLFRQYLCRVPAARLERLNVRPGMQRRYMRHIFYADAVDCLDVEDSVRVHCYREHIYSRNFDGEFQKYLKADTIISRENILRLLILLLMPDLDAVSADRWLIRLGYAPLKPERAYNGYVDDAVRFLLGLAAGRVSSGMEEDREQMKKILRIYDREVKKRLVKEQENGNTAVLQRLKNLRFMKYRSLDNE